MRYAAEAIRKAMGYLRVISTIVNYPIRRSTCWMKLVRPAYWCRKLNGGRPSAKDVENVMPRWPAFPLKASLELIRKPSQSGRTSNGWFMAASVLMRWPALSNWRGPALNAEKPIGATYSLGLPVLVASVARQLSRSMGTGLVRLICRNIWATYGRLSARLPAMSGLIKATC